MPDPVLEVSRQAVARLLLERQGLLGKRPRVRKTRAAEDVLAMVRRLECVQLDPVSMVERNQHLVLAARLRSYRPEVLEELLERGAHLRVHRQRGLCAADRGLPATRRGAAAPARAAGGAHRAHPPDRGPGARATGGGRAAAGAGL